MCSDLAYAMRILNDQIFAVDRFQPFNIFIGQNDLRKSNSVKRDELVSESFIIFTAMIGTIAA
jgi:hypothetical protein